MSDWGEKLTFFVYVEGHADMDDIERAARNIDAALDADFIGVRRDPIKEKPVDQVAT